MSRLIVALVGAAMVLELLGVVALAVRRRGLAVPSMIAHAVAQCMMALGAASPGIDAPDAWSRLGVFIVAAGLTAARITLPNDMFVVPARVPLPEPATRPQESVWAWVVTVAVWLAAAAWMSGETAHAVRVGLTMAAGGVCVCAAFAARRRVGTANR